MKQLFFLILTLGLSLNVFAQLKNAEAINDFNSTFDQALIGSEDQVRNCGTTIYENHLRGLDSEYDAKKEAIFREAKEIGENYRGNPVVTIPVVVHVVYSTSTQNISMTQIQSQIDILNKDYRRTNTDANQTPQMFQGVAADSEIEFCLASVDPNGNSTNGVTRTQTNVTSFSVPYNTNSPEPLKFTAQGGKNAWDTDLYLNMWIANISGGVLGYATFPGTASAAKDGVVVSYKYFGSTGTASPPYDEGRTATHEVGHYLGLRHIWGDGNCNADDGIADTPTSQGSYGTCETHPVSSCGTVDMFMNYMDYVPDDCMNLFTQGQKAVMVGVLQNTGTSGRKSLINHAATACGVPPPSPCNDLSGGPSPMGFEANENTTAWSIEDSNGDNSTWQIVDKPTNTTEWGPRTGNKFAVYLWNSNNAANDWLWSNCISFQDGHQYELSFWYCGAADYSSTYPEKLEVGLSTSQNAVDVIWTAVPEFTITNVYPSYMESKSTFTITGNGDAYIGFQAKSDADQYALQLDDILIRDITPVANEEVVENTTFQLFPNPASDLLHLQVSSEKLLDEAEVRIYDMTGKLITEQQFTAIQNEDITFDVSNYPNGIYMVNFVTNGKVSTEKVVISR